MIRVAAEQHHEAAKDAVEEIKMPMEDDINLQELSAREKPTAGPSFAEEKEFHGKMILPRGSNGLGKHSSTKIIKVSKSSAAAAAAKASSRAKYKVVFLGDVTVGKTSFISRFLYGSFNACYQPTIGIDFLSSNLNVDGHGFIRLQIWDTAGQERFRSLIPSYIRDSAIAFVLYDVTSRASFLNCRDWVSKVREEGGDDVIIMLVGNKIDREQDRDVRTEEGESLARELGCLFMEASAKSGQNVKNSFTRAASDLDLPKGEDDATKGAEQQQEVVKLDRMQLEVNRPSNGKGSCSC